MLGLLCLFFFPIRGAAAVLLCPQLISDVGLSGQSSYCCSPSTPYCHLGLFNCCFIWSDTNKEKKKEVSPLINLFYYTFLRDWQFWWPLKAGRKQSYFPTYALTVQQWPFETMSCASSPHCWRALWLCARWLGCVGQQCAPAIFRAPAVTSSTFEDGIKISLKNAIWRSARCEARAWVTRSGLQQLSFSYSCATGCK